jgi:hypothetical protein
MLVIGLRGPLPALFRGDILQHACSLELLSMEKRIARNSEKFSNCWQLDGNGSNGLEFQKECVPEGSSPGRVGNGSRKPVTSIFGHIPRIFAVVS